MTEEQAKAHKHWKEHALNILHMMLMMDMGNKERDSDMPCMSPSDVHEIYF